MTMRDVMGRCRTRAVASTAQGHTATTACAYVCIYIYIICILCVCIYTHPTTYLVLAHGIGGGRDGIYRVRLFAHRREGAYWLTPFCPVIVCSFTFLVTDETPGLEILLNGHWTSVTPVKGAFIVNLGDMLQVGCTAHTHPHTPIYIYIYVCTVQHIYNVVLYNHVFPSTLAYASGSFLECR